MLAHNTAGPTLPERTGPSPGPLGAQRPPEVLVRPLPLALSIVVAALLAATFGVAVLASTLPLLAGLVLGGAAAAAAALGQRLGDRNHLVPLYLPVRHRPRRSQASESE